MNRNLLAVILSIMLVLLGVLTIVVFGEKQLDRFSGMEDLMCFSMLDTPNSRLIGSDQGVYFNQTGQDVPAA